MSIDRIQSNIFFNTKVSNHKLNEFEKAFINSAFTNKPENPPAESPSPPEAVKLREIWTNAVRKIQDPNIKISQKFFNDLVKFSKKMCTRNGKTIKCNPSDLSGIIYQESKFNPQAHNGPYVGLIQIDKMTFDDIFPKPKKNDKDYAAKMKKYKSYEDYTKMKREDQFKYVEKYLQYRIEHAGKKLDRYIDRNGKIDGGALHVLIWRPGDFIRKDISESKLDAEVRAKRNQIEKNKKFAISSFDQKA